MNVLKNLTVPIILMMLVASNQAAEPEKDYPVKPVPFTSVQIADEFWSPRMETNRRVTIPYDFKKCEETGRIDNFARAGGLIPGKFEGIRYNDSDVFKVIEGAAYSLSRHPDAELEKYLDDLIAKIAAAQEDDGYLYTNRTIDPANPAPHAGATRWSYLIHSHELYNVGHMYEAAVAHFQATGKRSLLEIAIKNADLIDSVFGPGKRHDVPGHQEIEIGLAKLYRVTGTDRYLKLAKFFLDERGYAHGRELYGAYSQDHIPVVDQQEAVGHAVRAAYMYSGMADIAALTGDAAYVTAIDRIWENVVTKKLYITGGIGARPEGEAFGDNYYLPNASAYNETCAAIANMLWNHRLFLLRGDAKYLDVLERVLYNGFLSGVSLTGDTFFYPNPLESSGNHQRSPWFDCSCCPTNVVRFLPSLPGYVYAHKDDILYVNLFIAGQSSIQMAKNTVGITQETGYPWLGTVTITVNPEPETEFAIYLRIPGWAQNQPVPGDLYRYVDKIADPAVIKVNGNIMSPDLEKGFARIRRIWHQGDVIELALPMPIRRVLCHENVIHNFGKVALERGPIVYCAEWVDNNGHALNLLLPKNAGLTAEFRNELLNGMMVIRGKALGLYENKDHKTVEQRHQDFLAIPYYAWAHRGAGDMMVWLPTQASSARPLPAPTLAATAKASASQVHDALAALNDRNEPENSTDHEITRFTWWNHKGTEEWVQYNFARPEKINSVQIYWFDDSPVGGGCRIPASWRLLYKKGDRWQEVENVSDYGIEIDNYNKVNFKPVKTSALRLVVQLQAGYSGGILEWRVE